MFLAQFLGTMIVLGGAALFGILFVLPGLGIWFLGKLICETAKR